MNPLRMKSWIPWVLVLLGCLLPAGVTPAEALDIKVKDRATVSGGTISLRDIATFVPATDPRVDALSRIDVAAAPSPGNGVNLNLSFLNYKIGSVLSGTEDIRLEIPATVAVQRTAQTIPRSQLERIFRDHVQSRMQWPKDKVVFEKLDAPDGVSLPEGKVRWEIRERGSDRYLGHVALTINFYVDGKQIRNVPVSARITLRQAILKAARRINPGQVLGRDDVHLATEQNGTTLSREVLTDPEEAVDKKADTKTSRDSSIQAGISNALGWEGKIKNLTSLGKEKVRRAFENENMFKANLKSEFDGSGETTRDETMTASITARVMEVTPEGNLFIRGTREVKVNNETQFITLTGMIRPEDISPDNTVLSSYIADARIAYSGKGSVSDRQRPGWLMRAVDFVWPF